MGNNANNRNLYIDLIKGIAIITVIIGHLIQYTSVGNFNFYENYIYKFIYSFHIPLFMLISGYLFYFSLIKTSLLKLLKDKIIGIGVCLFTWNSIQFFLFSIVKGEPLSLNSYLDKMSGLWFLWSLLTCIIVFIIGKFIIKSRSDIFLFFLIPFVLFFPNGILTFFMYPYFFVGYLCVKYKQRIKFKYNKIILSISIPLFIIMFYFYDERHYIYITGIFPKGNIMYNEQVGIDLFRWIIGFAGSVVVLNLGKLIILSFEKNSIINFVSKIGIISLEIYVLQRLILESFFGNLYKSFTLKLGVNILATSSYYYLWIIILSCAIIFLIYFCTAFIKKNRILNFTLFGRKK